MKETTIEVEEKEVERVYCDECGDECTDTYRVEPKEVCRSCSSESSVDRIVDLSQPYTGEVIPFADMLILIAIYPLTMLWITRDSLHDNDDATPSALAVLVGGSILWTVGISLIILLL